MGSGSSGRRSSASRSATGGSRRAARDEGRRLRHREPCHGLALARLGRLVRARHSISELPARNGPKASRTGRACRSRSSNSTPQRRSSRSHLSITPLSEFDGRRLSPPRSGVPSKKSIDCSSCPDESDRYRLRNLDEDNVRAMLVDPAIEDTSGIDRSSMRTPDGAFPWLYLQLQRYLPVVRLRLLPGFVKTVNAEPWLTDVTFFTPWFVLVLELVRWLTSPKVRRWHRARDPGGLALDHHVSDARACVAGLPPGRHRCADGRPARLGIWRLWTVGGPTRTVVRPLAVVMILLTLASAVTYGRVIPRVGGVGVDGPTNFVRRLSGVGGLYATRPLESVRTARRAQASPVCRDGSTSAPATAPGWRSSDSSRRSSSCPSAASQADWRFTIWDGTVPNRIRRWSSNAGLDRRFRSSLAMDSEWGSFSRDYPAIRGWIDAHYDVVQQSAFEGGKPLSVLVQKSLARVGAHPSTDLPCFR